MTAPASEGPIELPDAASGLDIPASLHASIERHRSHLAQLTSRLRAAGLPHAQIEASVTMLIASYRAELIAVLKSLKGADHDPE